MLIVTIWIPVTISNGLKRRLKIIYLRKRKVLI